MKPNELLAHDFSIYSYYAKQWGVRTSKS